MKTIILIHGLYMNSLCFFFMKKELSKNNEFDVQTFNYNSLSYSEKILDKLNKQIGTIDQNNEIVIIAHSLGGLLTRLYFEKYQPSRKIKIITLGTPHQGSLIAKIINNSVLKPVLGKSTQFGLTKKIPDWKGNYPLISIAGIKEIRIAKLLFPKKYEQSDGTVFLKETILNNSQHICIDDCHHFELITSKKAILKIKNII